jgi:hypothetical protein
MASASIESPLHGYRGDAAPAAPKPRGLTVAISREAGARGGTIAKMVGEHLGWQVFDQEMLTFLANDEPARADLLADVPAGGREWADARLAGADAKLGPDLAGAVRLTLAVAARGDAVLIGRGAGFLLPAETTLHVRVVAPWEQRVAYLAQWLRLPRDEAAAEVRSRDEKRAALLDALTGREPGDATGYDLVLNSARLGLEACAELIAQAVRHKQLPAAV